VISRFRIKVVPACGDAHYFYADSYVVALEMMENLREDLRDMDYAIYLYVDTRYGHVRIS
jgi:hypothetical protein